MAASKKVFAFESVWTEKYLTNFQNLKSNFQSKANLDEKILLDEITHF